MNEMSEHYAALRDVPRKTAKRPRIERWDLIWSFGWRDIVLLSDRPYAACKAELNASQRLFQFRHGKFKIVPHR